MDPEAPSPAPVTPPPEMAEASAGVLTYPGKEHGLFARLRPTLRYWMEVEVHVYALSVAACVLLSFFPFLIVMVSFCRYVLHWPEAVRVIHLAIADFFPSDLYDFIQRNLMQTVYESAKAHGSFQVTSLLLLLFTANGVFVPFEVALNKAWGISHNRSYVKNQLVSFGLIFACGSLAMASFALTAANQEFFASWRWLPSWFALFVFKAMAVPLSILAIALVYWLLPNTQVRFWEVMPTAAGVGLALEALKWLNRLTWPLLKEKLHYEYGPFRISVAILLWSFAAAMIVLAGAERLGRKARG